jgi:predicted membrane GTPase involved in stress response
MLSSVNTTIDAIQGAKTSFVDTFVINKELKQPLKTFIDAQSSYAKDVAKSAFEFFTTVGASAASIDVKKAFATK